MGTMWEMSSSVRSAPPPCPLLVGGRWLEEEREPQVGVFG